MNHSWFLVMKFHYFIPIHRNKFSFWRSVDFWNKFFVFTTTKWTPSSPVKFTCFFPFVCSIWYKTSKIFFNNSFIAANFILVSSLVQSVGTKLAFHPPDCTPEQHVFGWHFLDNPLPPYLTDTFFSGQ